jgi:hypothetical protein
MVTYPSDFLASIPIATCQRSPQDSVHQPIELSFSILIGLETSCNAGCIYTNLITERLVNGIDDHYGSKSRFWDLVDLLRPL